MATDKHKKGDAHAKDPNSNAHDQAEKDMLKDPELSDPDPTDDLDEGELAGRDNSDEEALDYLEKPLHGGEGQGGHAGEGHGSHTSEGHGSHMSEGHDGHADKGGHSGKGEGK